MKELKSILLEALRGGTLNDWKMITKQIEKVYNKDFHKKKTWRKWFIYLIKEYNAVDITMDDCDDGKVYVWMNIKGIDVIIEYFTGDDANSNDEICNGIYFLSPADVKAYIKAYMKGWRIWMGKDGLDLIEHTPVK